MPTEAQVLRRITKKLLTEEIAKTPADRRRIQEGIEQVRWIAALKPDTIGVSPYSDDLRAYAEIAVLHVVRRPAPGHARVTELLHRAIPYPVFLIGDGPSGVDLSLVHKRWSQSDAGMSVLDGTLVRGELSTDDEPELVEELLNAVAIHRQPSRNLFALYQGWQDVLTAWSAARLTGSFRLPDSPALAAAWREHLQATADLETRIRKLRSEAARETQLSKRVELNLEIRRLKTQHEKSLQSLTPRDDEAIGSH